MTRRPYIAAVAVAFLAASMPAFANDDPAPALEETSKVEPVKTPTEGAVTVHFKTETPQGVVGMQSVSMTKADYRTHTDGEAADGEAKEPFLIRERAASPTRIHLKNMSYVIPNSAAADVNTNARENAALPKGAADPKLNITLPVK